MKLSRPWVIAASGAVVLASGVGVTLGLTGGTGGTEVTGAPSEPVASGPAWVVFDEASATLASQDAYSTTSVDKNGVHRTVLSPTVVNVKVGDSWLPASAALADDGNGGLEAIQHPLALDLAPTASDPNLVSATSAGYSVTFALKGAAAAPLEHVADSDAPSAVADHAVYAEVFPGTDLRYDVSPSALKESVVLSEAPTSADAAYTWSVRAAGLVLEKNEFGDLEFVDPSGAVIFSMPIPVMWDSSGVEGEREAADANIPYEIAPAADGTYNVTVRPSAAWLGDSARVYPVYVDPTLSTGPYTFRQYKSDGVVENVSVRVGNVHSSSTCCNWRTVASYDYSTLMSRQVIGASLTSSLLGGTANCYDGGVYNATYWGYAGKGDYLSAFANCTTGGADEDIYRQVAAWVRGGVTNGALMFTGYEAPLYSYKALSTVLSIDWVPAPTVTNVVGSTPKNGEAAVAFPVMQATGTISAGSNQFFQYAFVSDNGGQSFTSQWTSSGPYRVPDGALTAGKHYTYSIKTRDDFPVSPEPTTNKAAWSFTMDAAPGAPTNLRVDHKDLTENRQSDDARPEVCATVADPDGGTVQALFTVKQGGIAIVDSLPGTKVSATGTPASSSCAALPYPLSADATYTLEVSTSDGYLVTPMSPQPAWTIRGPEQGASREILGPSDAVTSAYPTQATS